MLIETVCVRARACVRVNVREWTGVRRPTWRKLYTNANLLLYVKTYPATCPNLPRNICPNKPR